MGLKFLFFVGVDILVFLDLFVFFWLLIDDDLKEKLDLGGLKDGVKLIFVILFLDGFFVEGLLNFVEVCVFRELLVDGFW